MQAEPVQLELQEQLETQQFQQGQAELEILVQPELRAQREQVLLQERPETQELLELQAQLEMQQCLQWRAELEILA